MKRYSDQQLARWRERLATGEATLLSLANELLVSHVTIYWALHRDKRQAWHRKWYAKRKAAGRTPYQERKEKLGAVYVSFERKLRRKGLKGVRLEYAMAEARHVELVP